MMKKHYIEPAITMHRIQLGAMIAESLAIDPSKEGGNSLVKEDSWDIWGESRTKPVEWDDWND